MLYLHHPTLSPQCSCEVQSVTRAGMGAGGAGEAGGKEFECLFRRLQNW